MKTSLLLLIAIFLNTTLLLSDPLSAIVAEINTWVLLAIEAVLLCGYYLNRIVKELREACELDLGDLNVFVLNSTKK